MDVKVKLCGLRTEADIAAANAAKPDYVGFILTARFWRFVPPETVRALRRGLAPGILTVGVVVDEPPAYAARLLNEGVVDIVQLHGHEDAAYLAALRALAPGRELWKALRVTSAADLNTARACTADRLLLDSGAGTGQTFDWRLLAGFDRPFLLAGGLDPGNVAQAVARLHPWGVDTSSGTETDRRKDPAKMRAFVQAARGAARADNG